MAVPATLSSVRFLPIAPSPTRAGHRNLPIQHKPTCVSQTTPLFLNLDQYRSRRKERSQQLINAIEEGQEENLINPNSEEESDTQKTLETSSELGSEIKEAMMKAKIKERDMGDKTDLWSGVAEEIRQIEWPAFSKVVGTTGVVLGVIAGSSIALLTVNAVLAELSDRIFAGKGVQDFFS